MSSSASNVSVTVPSGPAASNGANIPILVLETSAPRVPAFSTRDAYAATARAAATAARAAAPRRARDRTERASRASSRVSSVLFPLPRLSRSRATRLRTSPRAATPGDTAAASGFPFAFPTGARVLRRRRRAARTRTAFCFCFRAGTRRRRRRSGVPRVESPPRTPRSRGPSSGTPAARRARPAATRNEDARRTDAGSRRSRSPPRLPTRSPRRATARRRRRRTRRTRRRGKAGPARSPREAPRRAQVDLRCFRVALFRRRCASERFGHASRAPASPRWRRFPPTRGSRGASGSRRSSRSRTRCPGAPLRGRHPRGTTCRGIAS